MSSEDHCHEVEDPCSVNDAEVLYWMMRRIGMGPKNIRHYMRIQGYCCCCFCTTAACTCESPESDTDDEEDTDDDELM